MRNGQGCQDEDGLTGVSGDVARPFELHGGLAESALGKDGGASELERPTDDRVLEFVQFGPDGVRHDGEADRLDDRLL